MKGLIYNFPTNLGHRKTCELARSSLDIQIHPILIRWGRDVTMTGIECTLSLVIATRPNFAREESDTRGKEEDRWVRGGSLTVWLVGLGCLLWGHTHTLAVTQTDRQARRHRRPFSRWKTNNECIRKEEERKESPLLEVVMVVTNSGHKCHKNSALSILRLSYTGHH